MVKVLVLGDLMIDHYVWGTCDRISPEAPVQVINAKKETKRLGGCGNVVSNLIALGAQVGVISVVGDDENGDEILELLKMRGAKAELIIKEKGRKSSLKSRIMVAHQQVLRIDNESVGDVKCADEILAKFDEILRGYDIVLLSDYGKGVLTHEICAGVIEKTTIANKFSLIDPKGADYSKYRGATLLTPNRKEASIALQTPLNSRADVDNALRKLKEKFDLKYGLITLSEEGIGLYDGEKFSHFGALAKEVFDVTGAGDSVLATLGYCLADNESIESAIKTANLAAAVVVGKVGSADASWSEIEALKCGEIGFWRKIVGLEECVNISSNFSRAGKKIVFTNGCFDILHSGHVSYLQKARNLGDLLIVGLNSDESIRRLKGASRPINSQRDRATLLAALEFVDFVVIFNEDTPLNLIKALRPDILVKGADYAGKEVVGSEFANATQLIEFVEGKSTSKIIEKIRGKDEI